MLYRNHGSVGIESLLGSKKSAGILDHQGVLVNVDVCGFRSVWHAKAGNRGNSKFRHHAGIISGSR